MVPDVWNDPSKWFQMFGTILVNGSRCLERS